MNNNVKRSLTTVLCGAMILAAASCGSNTRTALTVDGKDISAGIYIYYQMAALGEAQSKLSEEQPELDMSAEDFDITEYSVEDTPISDWVKNRAIEQCRKYVAINNKFDDLGLSLSADETSEINEYVTQLWTEENMYAQYIYGVDILGEYYEKYGIGQQSFKNVYTISYKQNAIFNALYGEGGSLEVSADELKNYVSENYALAEYIEIDEGYDAQEYLSMLESGKTFPEMKQAYETAKELADIEKEMVDAEANGEEYTGTKPDELTVAVSEESELLRVIEKDSEIPSADFVSSLFTLKNGENNIIITTEETTDDEGNQTTEYTYYVASRLDITANEEKMTECTADALHKLKDDEYDAAITSEADALSVAENSAAMNRYTVKSLLK